MSEAKQNLFHTTNKKNVPFDVEESIGKKSVVNSIITVAETFETMKSLFDPEAARGLNKTIQWNISGEDAGKWAVKIANQACEVILGGVERPDLTLSMSGKDWLAIAEGRMDTMQAFTTGKIKAAGDLSLAMRVNKLFPGNDY